MTLRRFMLLRRVTGFAAGAVLAVSLVAWIVSLRGLTWSHRSGLSIWLIGGDVIAHNEGSLTEIFGFDMLGSYRPPKWSSPQWSGVNGLGYWSAVVPLWILIVLSGGALVIAPLVGRRTVKRVHRGHCLVCGYDLTGITGPCPECGHSP